MQLHMQRACPHTHLCINPPTHARAPTRTIRGYLLPTPLATAGYYTVPAGCGGQLWTWCQGGSTSRLGSDSLCWSTLRHDIAGTPRWFSNNGFLSVARFGAKIRSLILWVWLQYCNQVQWMKSLPTSVSGSGGRTRADNPLKMKMKMKGQIC